MSRRRKTKGGNDYAQADANWLSLRKAIREAFAPEPDNVNGQWAYRTAFYKDQLELVVKGLVKIECPDTWDTDFLLDTLMFEGKFLVTDTDIGVIGINCATWGQNVYYRNSKASVANPVLGDFDRTIGEDGELVYLMGNRWFRTFRPIVDIYAEKLASCDATIDVNLMNTRVAWIARAESQKQANEMKMVYDKVSRGEPAVFVGEQGDIGGTFEFFNSNVKQMYVADLIQTEKKAIMNEFLTMIGVNNTNIEKKERLITGEVDGNVDEIKCNIIRIRDNLRYCEKRVRNMFGDVMKFGFPFWDILDQQVEEGGDDNGNDADKSNGAV